MSFFAMVVRLLLNFSADPVVQDALQKAGAYAIRQGAKALIKAVQRGNPKIEMKRVK